MCLWQAGLVMDSEILGPAREDNSHSASTFKSLLMLHLLLSHWPKQVIWCIPESLWEELPKACVQGDVKILWPCLQQFTTWDKCVIPDMFFWGKNTKSQAIKKGLANYGLKAKFCLLPIYIKFYWNRAIPIICILSMHALMIQWQSWVDATEYVLPEKLKIFVIWPIIKKMFVG